MARMPGALDDTQRRLVEANVGLVEHIATRLMRRFANADREELVRVGMLGLVEAASRFEAERGFAFSSFAGVRIEGAMLDELRRNDRLSRSVRAFQRELLHAEQAFAARHGRMPDRSELATALGVAVSALDAHTSQVAAAAIESLDGRGTDDTRAVRLSEALPDARADVESILDQRELLDAVRRCLGRLDERLRFVVVAYLIEGRPLLDIAETLGVSRSRVSQLKDEGVRAIRVALADELGDAAPPIILDAVIDARPRRRPQARPMAGAGAALLRG